MKLFSKDWWAKQLFKENLLTSDEVHNLIPGGLAKGKTINDIVKKYNSTLDIVKKQLKKGIKVELEHTTSKEIALEIAMDHLWEDLHYYDKLKKIEELSINNPVITPYKAYNYFKDNIYHNNQEFGFISTGWQEYIKLSQFCVEKYNISIQDHIVIYTLEHFAQLPLGGLNHIYKGMRQIVRKYGKKEIL